MLVSMAPGKVGPSSSPSRSLSAPVPSMPSPGSVAPRPAFLDLAAADGVFLMILTELPRLGSREFCGSLRQSMPSEPSDTVSASESKMSSRATVSTASCAMHARISCALAQQQQQVWQTQFFLSDLRTCRTKAKGGVRVRGGGGGALRQRAWHTMPT